MSAFLRTASRAAARPSVRAFSSTPARPIARITLVGNLADTPELRASSTGREYVRYAVASNSGPRDSRVTSWFNVSAFPEEGPRRDHLLGLPKGSTVYVEADVTTGSYVAEDGSKKSTLNIVQQKLEVVRRGVESE